MTAANNDQAQGSSVVASSSSDTSSDICVSHFIFLRLEVCISNHGGCSNNATTQSPTTRLDVFDSDVVVDSEDHTTPSHFGTLPQFPSSVVQDLRIVGKFWGDVDEEEAAVDGDNVDSNKIIISEDNEDPSKLSFLNHRKKVETEKENSIQD